MWALALLLRALLALLSPSGWWPPRQPCRVVSRTDSPFAGLSFPPHAPPTLCPWYHTLVGALFGPRVEYRRELLRGPGGPFALDWALGGGTAPRAALLLATPTCSDSAGSNVRSLAAAAVARGLAVAVYNRRGHSGVGIEAGRAFPLYGDVADLGHAAAHVGAALPGVPLFCVGLSAGAAETVFFLASDHPAATRVSGGVSVSNGHDLPRFERANPGAARHLVAKFRALMRRPCNAAALYSACAASRFSSPRTFRELEAALVLCGAADADALAAGRRCTAQLAAVRVPLLCLGAADDPLVPAALTSLADAAALANPLVVSATTPTGGHLGWLQRRSDGRSDRWWTAAALDFVDAVLEGGGGRAHPGGGGGAPLMSPPLRPAAKPDRQRRGGDHRRQRLGETPDHAAWAQCDWVLAGRALTEAEFEAFREADRETHGPTRDTCDRINRTPPGSWRQRPRTRPL